MVLQPADRGNPPSGESSRSVESPLLQQTMDAASPASSVLVVDDEPQVVWVLQFSLEAEGYETFTATNGLEAMAQISEHHPSLMVLDVMMPRMDGWSVLEALLKLPEEERPRVVMVTALASLRDRTKAAELGAAAYVPKPFDLDELLEVLHGLERAS
jgi:two-component system OmpR family response regulator